MEDTVVLLGFKVFNSDSSFLFFCCKNTTIVTFVEKMQLKIISFNILNIDIEESYDIVFNWALQY